MRQIDLLLPFALPPAEMAADLLRAIKAPSLAMLLGRANTAPQRSFDDFAPALPHERWLAERFGLQGNDAGQNSPPVARAAMNSLVAAGDPGVWFMLQPVHFHVTRDHLVLTDTRRLALTDADARSLFAAAAPAFAEAGLPLLYGDPGTWFLRADAWAGLQTTTPDAACGHNIDIWMPKGEHARAWRKLQNEVQMEWHTSEVNAARELAGLKTINSLWLWGGTATGALASAPYGRLANLQGWLRAAGPAETLAAHELIEDAPPLTLCVNDTLAEAALGSDWSEWLARLQVLEAEWFTPLLAGLRRGQFDHLRLIMSHNTRLAELSVTRNALRRFWCKPTLSRLAA